MIPPHRTAQEARELREIFDERFSNPYELHGHRFMWDYW